MSSSDSSSITLTWKRPETNDGSDVKGYEVEVRSSNNLNWTKCNALPIETTTYTVKGLQAKEIYFLRVRALNDSGPGEAAELEALLGPAPPIGKSKWAFRTRSFYRQQHAGKVRRSLTSFF